MWNSEDLGKVEFDPKFDLSSVDAQAYIMFLCGDLKKKTFVENRQVNCWLDKFDDYVRKENASLSLPIQPTDFNKYLNKYIQTPEGKFLVSDGTIGIKKGKL